LALPTQADLGVALTAQPPLRAARNTDGFVERISYPVVPPHVEYRLSPMGQDIGRKVEALADWVEQQLPKIIAARAAHKARLAESD
jgi:DNA-binding HxlR family transcriptional regulator